MNSQGRIWRIFSDCQVIEDGKTAWKTSWGNVSKETENIVSLVEISSLSINNPRILFIEA